MTYPEIPCSYDTDDTFRDYKRCVRKALKNYRRAGIIDHGERNKLMLSAFRAYGEHHNG